MSDNCCTSCGANLDQTADQATIQDVVSRLDAVENRIASFVADVKPIMDEIVPTLETFMNSTMGKMMFGKGKK